MLDYELFKSLLRWEVQEKHGFCHQWQRYGNEFDGAEEGNGDFGCTRPLLGKMLAINTNYLRCKRVRVVADNW